jgi:hypothetical protein
MAAVQQTASSSQQTARLPSGQHFCWILQQEPWGSCRSGRAGQQIGVLIGQQSGFARGGASVSFEQQTVPAGQHSFSNSFGQHTPSAGQQSFA